MFGNPDRMCTCHPDVLPLLFRRFDGCASVWGVGGCPLRALVMLDDIRMGRDMFLARKMMKQRAKKLMTVRKLHFCA